MEPVSKAELLAAKKAQLLAALNGQPLTPEITKDEIENGSKASDSREAEYRANKPPHHE